MSIHLAESERSQRQGAESNAVLSDSYGNQLRYSSTRKVEGERSSWIVSKGTLVCKSVHGLVEFPLLVRAGQHASGYDNPKLMNIINGAVGQSASRQQSARDAHTLQQGGPHPIPPGTLRNEELSRQTDRVITTNYALKADAVPVLQYACRTEFENRGFYYQDGLGHFSPPPAPSTRPKVSAHGR